MAKPTLGQCSALLCFFFCWCWCCYCCCCCCCCCYYCCYCCVPLIGLRSLFRLGRFALPCLALPCRCYLLSLLLMPVADSAAIAFLPSSSPAKSVIWAPLISYPHPSSAAASSRPPPPSPAGLNCYVVVVVAAASSSSSSSSSSVAAQRLKCDIAPQTSSRLLTAQDQSPPSASDFRSSLLSLFLLFIHFFFLML